MFHAKQLLKDLIIVLAVFVLRCRRTELCVILCHDRTRSMQFVGATISPEISYEEVYLTFLFRKCLCFKLCPTSLSLFSQSPTRLSVNMIKYPEYVPDHFENLINFFDP